MMTRDAHIAWCKQRTLDALKRDGLQAACAEMITGLGQRNDLQDYVGGHSWSEILAQWQSQANAR